MRLILDTHAVIWLYEDVRSFSGPADAALETATEVVVSVVAFAELGIKAATGKLRVPVDLERRLADDGIGVLPLRPVHGLTLEHLPLHHRDPFDRLLIAQAQIEDLTILTSDAAFAAYDVRTLDPLT